MTRDQIFDALRTNIRTELVNAGVAGANQLQILEGSTPRDIGGHSIVLMKAIESTIRQLRLQVPRDLLLQTRTIGDVLNLLERAAP